MSWSVIEKGRLYCIFGNHLRSIPRLNLTIKCFKSDDRKQKGSEIRHKENINNNSFKKNKIFNIISGNSREAKKEVTKKKEFSGDYRIKLKSILNSTEEFENSGEDLKIDLTVKPKKKDLVKKVTDTEKQKFLNLAKQIAQDLKIDVTKTQEELFDHYRKTEALKDYVANDQNGKEDGSKQGPTLKMGYGAIRHLSQAGDLGIFGLSSPGEEEGEKMERENVKVAPEEVEEVEEKEKEKVKLKVEEETEGEWRREVKLDIWNALESLERYELYYKSPSNYFEELELWTELGMLHRFPIDNEQDWHEEHNTVFTEHIFLEKHLEPWCPKKGPLRHFMELITTGLSKNPYISAKKKQEHVLWYRDYFMSKSSLLKEIGVDLNVEESNKNEKREMIEG